MFQFVVNFIRRDGTYLLSRFINLRKKISNDSSFVSILAVENDGENQHGEHYMKYCPMLIHRMTLSYATNLIKNYVIS